MLNPASLPICPTVTARSNDPHQCGAIVQYPLPQGERLLFDGNQPRLCSCFGIVLPGGDYNGYRHRDG